MRSVMPSKVYSAAVVGVEAFEVEIEVHAGWVPPTRSRWSDCRIPRSKRARQGHLRHFQQRVSLAVRKRITIHLAPADVRKEGPSFDLPIALAMPKLKQINRLPALDAFCITGELALSGQCAR